ncbi:aspartic proteinase-like protein 2-like, partial [Trifolium medium]|nr:aspartic proteinase-like protein 2-like [Trifolium medium]
PHYNLNLQSISVNGQTLQIDASVFATSNNRGTIVDSGTTLAYLAEEAYDPFVNAITATIPQSVRTVVSRGNQCFLITNSVTDIFPQVSLNFAGGASLDLRPQDYLIQQNSISSALSGNTNKERQLFLVVQQCGVLAFRKSKVKG